MDLNILLVVLCVVCCIALLLFACWQGRMWLLRKNGGYGSHQVGQVLRRFAAPRYFKTFENITLSFGGKTRTIPHLLIGFFGILLVSVVEEDGEYFGEHDGKDWLRTGDEYRRVRIPNHLAELEESAVFLRGLFGSQNIYRVPIDTLVVFTGRPKQTEVGINGAGEHITSLRGLKKLLLGTKFEKDTGLQVEAMAKVFEESRV